MLRALTRTFIVDMLQSNRVIRSTSQVARFASCHSRTYYRAGTQVDFQRKCAINPLFQNNVLRKSLSTQAATSDDAVAEESFEYQAEVSRLLDLIVNSVYSNKEIFIRELISNSSDALDKVRFLSISDEEILKDTNDLRIQIRGDPDSKSIYIEDTGIGMTKDDLKSSLGTIARSGTAKFQELLQGAKEDSSLIGQFGVGFYSSFLVAQKVTVQTKSPYEDVQYRWDGSAGSSEFKIAVDNSTDKLKRGTRITLYLKDEAEEYANDTKLSELVKKYSEFIKFPIDVWTTKQEPKQVLDGKATEEKQKKEDEEAEKDEREPTKVEPVYRTEYEEIQEWQKQNANQPIWLRDAKEIEADDYNRFYKSAFKEFMDPLAYKHFKAEGTIEFTSLLYIPSVAPQQQADLMTSKQRNIKLFVKRVYISDEFDEDLLPRYMCFVKGVVDSMDLPLNVSREILQESRTVRAIRKQLVRRTLDMLFELRNKEDQTEFDAFWENFSRFVKLGIVEDQPNKDRLSKLIKFHSSAGEDFTYLEDYVKRMKEGQQKIYYMASESLEGAKEAPFVEKLIKKGYEVLYLIEPIDELCLMNLVKFNDLEFLDVTKEDLELGEEAEDVSNKVESFEVLCKFLKDTLENRVEKVVVSTRLDDSPCALVTSKFGWSANMEKVMRSQTMGDTRAMDYMVGKKILEINPDSPVIIQMLERVKANESDPANKPLAELLFETCLLTSGFEVKRPKDYAGKVYKMMGMLGADEEVNGDGAKAEGGDKADEGKPIEPEVVQ